MQKIIANARMAAFRDRYEQTVYLDELNEPSFCRKGTLNLSNCKILGEIKISYKNGVQHRKYIKFN